MKRFACVVAAVFALISADATQRIATAPVIPYPVPAPGSTPLVFLADLVSRKGSLEFNAAFYPDDKSFYFSVSRDRQWDIYVSRHDGSRWGPPVRAPFSEDTFSEADPVCTPDGKIYFISNRPKGNVWQPGDFDIWFVEPLPGGRWSAPQNMTELNSEHDEYYISFSRKGDVYFGSDRPGGFGSMDLYVSRRGDGHHLPPENLGPGINTTESEHDACLVSADEDLLVFKSENRPDGLGEADLYASRRGPDGKWGKAVNLGPTINTPAYEYCSYLTPDRRYFFFSSEHDIKWVDAADLRRLIAKLLPKGSDPAAR